MKVNEIVCINKSLGIYASESGLSALDCNNIINISEYCATSRGGWSSYTYAKQALICRENDLLSFVCARPVMLACATIRQHLMGKQLDNDDATNSNSSEKTKMQRLVLDAREPHVVKYDTSKMERKKLDMHT